MTAPIRRDEPAPAQGSARLAAHHRAPDDEPGSAALGRALARLTARDLEVLRLAGWEGLTPAEIAVLERRFGISNDATDALG